MFNVKLNFSAYYEFFVSQRYYENMRQPGAHREIEASRCGTKVGMQLRPSHHSSDVSGQPVGCSVTSLGFRVIERVQWAVLSTVTQPEVFFRAISFVRVCNRHTRYIVCGGTKNGTDTETFRILRKVETHGNVIDCFIERPRRFIMYIEKLRRYCGKTCKRRTAGVIFIMTIVRPSVDLVK